MIDGDEAGATRTAGDVSRYVAYGLIGLGIALFAATGVIGGLWLAVLGWFILNAARTETRQVAVFEALDGMTVGQLMTAHPTTVHETLDVQSLIDQYVLGQHYSSYPVLDRSDRPAGIVTLDDVRRVPSGRRASTPVQAIMQTPPSVPLLHADEPARDALSRIAASGGRRALVLDGGCLIGIVSLSDIARIVEAHELASPATGDSRAA
jgi:CBS domain-containing protein